MTMPRFQQLLLAASVAVTLLQLANTSAIKDASERTPTSPPSANPECDSGSAPSDAAASLASESTTRASASNRWSWLRNLEETCKRPLRCSFNYVFSRPSNVQRSRAQQGIVNAASPFLHLYDKAMQNHVAIVVSDKCCAVSGRAIELLDVLWIFLWKVKANFPKFMVVTGVLTKLEIFMYFAYLLYSIIYVVLQTCWSYKGTLIFSAVLAPFIIYSIEEEKKDNQRRALAQPDEGVESGLPVDPKRTVHGIETPTSESFQLQDDNDHSETSSSFWVWISAAIVIGVVAISSTSYVVYKRMQLRQSVNDIV